MSTGDPASGLGTAVAVIQAATGGMGEPAAAVEQPPLPLEPSSAVREIAANTDSSPRGPGRPPGSKNKRTEEWVEFILSRYRSPLVVLAEVYSRSVVELAKELGCDRLEAFDRQLQAARVLAPYLHQAQPQAVRIDGKGILQLVINPYGGQDPAALDQGENSTLTIIDQKPDKSEG